MRIARLALLKYGKFSGHTVELPRAECDLHVIVGPNEAGKSTLRAAVSDLLYGFPKSPPQAFVHPMNELRLGAVLEHAGERLEFQRSKGLKNTVRSPDDVPLPDAVLAPFLGPTDRAFFEQMFGLDHPRLVAGGHDILSAGSEVGKVLFAAASGIDGVSRLRAALEAEADALWAPRKSKDREYHAAFEAYEAAAAALKAATVRSAAWAELQADVTRLEAALAEARVAHNTLQKRRNTLERVRRVAPALAMLQEARTALAALGTTPDLPAGAAQTLADTERELAIQQAALTSQQALQAEAAARRSAIQVDDAVLALAADIASLDELRLQLRTHESDLLRREAELGAAWRKAADAAVQLGWAASAGTLTEPALRARLLPLPQRKSLERLLGQHAALAQAAQAAAQAEQAKVAELQQVEARLLSLPAAAEPIELQAALAAAQQLGDVPAVARQREAERVRWQGRLKLARAALKAWPADDIEQLRAISPPSAEALDSFRQQQAGDEAELRAVLRRIETLQADRQAKELEIAQYRDTHTLVTRDDVLALRQARDGLWSDLRQGRQAIDAVAPAFERAVADADRGADTREATLQQATTLLGKQHELQRLALELAAQQALCERTQQASVERAERWAALVAGCGLAGMPQDALATWLEARRATLAAAEGLDEAERACREIDEASRTRYDALRVALRSLGQQADAGATLAALVLQASAFIQSVSETRGERLTLRKQAEDATARLASLRRDADRARMQLDGWAQSWRQATAPLALVRDGPAADAAADISGELGQVQGALELSASIDAALAEMATLREQRIEPMRADLARLAAEASRLGGALRVDSVGRPAAEVALALAARLRQAITAKDDADRETMAERAAQAKVLDAQTTIATLQAGLRPLLERSGANTLPELALAIQRADTARQWAAKLAAAEQGLRDSGDGLSTAQLQAEADALPLDQVSAQVLDLTAQLDGLRERQNALSAQHATAADALARIAGSADAAKCESRRQEALARMADAVERYVKVHTAAQLLKWAIERYRENRQGPMLARAGAIFARLTLGSFDALTLDFDSDTLKLQGRRPSGTSPGTSPGTSAGGARVDVAGMSEGTRDQLYLALRLAALDLHLGQAHALPFIADDLFINYDDARSRAGLLALGDLARKTQVIFLTHHAHLLPLVRELFGPSVNVVDL